MKNDNSPLGIGFVESNHGNDIGFSSQYSWNGKHYKVRVLFGESNKAKLLQSATGEVLMQSLLSLLIIS